MKVRDRKRQLEVGDQRDENGNPERVFFGILKDDKRGNLVK